MATSADVPHRFDCVINSEGYLLLDPFQDDANAPQKAVYGYTPAFLPRSNVGEGFGDNQQDFWMTYSQKDWSLGKGQKYQGRGDEAGRRYWNDSQVDVIVPGQMTLQPGIDSLTLSGAPEAMCYMPSQDAVAIAGTTNLFTVTADGTVTDEGVHGLGAAPARWGMVSDGVSVYITTQAAGTVGVRRWTGSAFSTFSANGQSALAYLNNTLFGLGEGGGLSRFSTGGVRTTIHTWRQAEGTAVTLGTNNRIRAYGGKLLILLDQGMQQPELWIYDGVGVSKLADFSANFTTHGLEVLTGVAFISGYLEREGAYRPVVYYYANGSIGKLWEAEEYGSFGRGSPDLSAFDEKLIFNGSQEGKIHIYNPQSGGISSLGPYAASETRDSIVAAADSFLVITHGGGGSNFQTPELVQSHSRSFTTASSVGVSWPAPTTAGNTLLLGVLALSKAGGTPTINLPSGWTNIGTRVFTTNDDVRLSLYKIEGAASRSGSQNVTFSVDCEGSLMLWEYSGTGVQDVVAVTAENNTTTLSTGSTLTTTQDDELWFVVAGAVAGNAKTLSDPTDDFEETREQVSSQTTQTSFHKNVAATGTASMSADYSSAFGAQEGWGSIIVTFKAKAEGEGYLFPASSKATGGNITSSLIDFDSSLDKMFRGVTVDYVAGEDGDGGSVDISYRVNSQDADPEDLQVSADSGTEYTFTDETGRSLSTTITLNKGTSTDGPILKRAYVRAAPLTNVYKRRRYTFNCTGRNTDSLILLRDHTYHTKDGLEMATDLQTASESQSPLTIIDKLGSFTGVIEELELIEVRPEEFVARVLAREV